MTGDVVLLKLLKSLRIKKKICLHGFYFSLTNLSLTILSMMGHCLNCHYYLGYFFLNSEREFKSPFFFEKLVNRAPQNTAFFF